jgi:hypothetical protein
VKVKDVPHEPADLGRVVLAAADLHTLPPDTISLRVNGRAADLSVLAGTGVTELELDAADLATLAGARVSKLVLHDRTDLTTLPPLPLRSLTVIGVPSAAYIEHLAGIGLTHHAVHQPYAGDLPRLDGMPGLRELDLYGCRDAPALAGPLVRCHP